MVRHNIFRTRTVAVVASLVLAALPSIAPRASAAGEYWRYPKAGTNWGYLQNVNALLADGSTLLFAQGGIGGGINTQTGITANGVGALDTTNGTVVDYGGGSSLNTASNNCGRYAGRPFVSALAGTKNDLYVAGGFDSIGGISNVPGIARRQVVGGVATWTSLGSRRGLCGSHTFGDYWRVTAVAVGGSNVYATGTFLNANGTDSADGATTVNQIAMWNGSTWAALGGGLKTTTADSSPNNVTWGKSLVWDTTNEVLYVGGYFDSVSNTLAGSAVPNTSSIACWNPATSTWSAIGAGSSTTTNRVSAMTLDPTGRLVVGGVFSSMGGIAADYIARFTPTGACVGNWASVGSPPFSDRCSANLASWADIPSVTTDPDSGNIFASCERDGGLHPNVAKWDGSSWTWLPGIDESAGPSDEIGRSINGAYTMSLINSHLWAGGRWYNNQGGSSGLATIAVPDTTAPVVTLTSSTITPSASATVQSTETGTAYLVKTTVAVSNEASITGASGTLWNSVTISAANTGTSLSASGLVDGTYKAYAVDGAGNLSGASTGTVTVDSDAPSVTVTRPGSGTVGGGQDITITFTLSESSSNFAVGDVSVTGGTLSGFTGSGATYTATWTPPASGSGTTTISVTANKFTDAAGNNNTASAALSIAWNADRPSVAVTRAGSATVGAGQTVLVTFTLSESSSNFAAGDIDVSSGTLSGFTGSGATYTATWTPPASGSGTTTISVTANKFTDAAGNNNTASVALSITYDTNPATTTTLAQSGLTNSPGASVPAGTGQNTGDGGATGGGAAGGGAVGATTTTTTTTTTLAAEGSDAGATLNAEELAAAAEKNIATAPSRAPRLSANGAVALIGDDEATTEVTRTATEIVVTVQDMTARLGMRSPDGTATDLDSSGRLKAGASGAVGMGVDGFAGSTPVVVWIFSEPVKVGTARTGNNGAVESQFNLGPGTPVGDHTVVLVGTDARGEKVTIGVGLTIEDNPESTTQQSPAGYDKENGVNLRILWVLLALAVVGALFLPAGLRRRRSEDTHPDA
jgi:hypothetical protein